VNAAEFKAEVLEHYTDSDGLVTKDRDPRGVRTGGNQLILTSLFYYLLWRAGACKPEDVTRFNWIVNSCWAFGMPGLLDRNPGRPDFEAIDDYRAVLFASHFLNTVHAGQIVSYGEDHWWIFNNVKPGLITAVKWGDACFYRYPGFPGYARLCACRPAGPLQAFMLGCSISSNAYGMDADQKILTWMAVQVARERALMNCMDAVELWERKLSATYGSIAKVFATSYGADHPVARFSLLAGQPA